MFLECLSCMEGQLFWNYKMSYVIIYETFPTVNLIFFPVLGQFFNHLQFTENLLAGPEMKVFCINLQWCFGEFFAW